MVVVVGDCDAVNKVETVFVAHWVPDDETDDDIDLSAVKDCVSEVVTVNIEEDDDVMTPDGVAEIVAVCDGVCDPDTVTLVLPELLTDIDMVPLLHVLPEVVAVTVDVRVGVIVVDGESDTVTDIENDDRDDGDALSDTVLHAVELFVTDGDEEALNTNEPECRGEVEVDKLAVSETLAVDEKVVRVDSEKITDDVCVTLVVVVTDVVVDGEDVAHADIDPLDDPFKKEGVAIELPEVVRVTVANPDMLMVGETELEQDVVTVDVPVSENVVVAPPL